METAHTGKLNYHLKILGDLIQRDEDSTGYRLTEKGRLGLQLLSQFSSPQTKVGPTFSMTNLPKVLGIAGGALYLVGALPFLSWGLTLIAYTVAVIGSGVVMIMISGVFYAKSKSQDRWAAVLGIIVVVFGFTATKVIAPLHLGHEYPITNLGIGDPIVIGFVLGLTGFFLDLSLSQGSMRNLVP